ncbi:MAG: hypothetical protein KDB52_04585 [Solirubrobacterales bacterium]|nr:hypothetical protein [Solirubrobacterales bacterium]
MKHHHHGPVLAGRAPSRNQFPDDDPVRATGVWGSRPSLRASSLVGISWTLSSPRWNPPLATSFSWKAPRKLAGRKASFAFTPKSGTTRRISVKITR